MNQDFHTVGEAVDVQQTPQTHLSLVHARINYLEIAPQPRLRLRPKTHHSNHAQTLDLQSAAQLDLSSHGVDLWVLSAFVLC